MSSRRRMREERKSIVVGDTSTTKSVVIPPPIRTTVPQRTQQKRRELKAIRTGQAALSTNIHLLQRKGKMLGEMDIETTEDVRKGISNIESYNEMADRTTLQASTEKDRLQRSRDTEFDNMIKIKTERELYTKDSYDKYMEGYEQFKDQTTKSIREVDNLVRNLGDIKESNLKNITSIQDRQSKRGIASRDVQLQRMKLPPEHGFTVKQTEDGFVVKWSKEGERDTAKVRTEEEVERWIQEKKVAETLGISMETFNEYPEGKQNVLINQLMGPMKFIVTYTDESGNKVTESFDNNKEAEAKALEINIAQNEAALKTAQDEVRRQKRSLVAGLFGISSVMSAGGLWGKWTDPKQREQMDADVNRAFKTFIDGGIDAAPAIIFTNALAAGAFAAGSVIGTPVLGSLAMGAVYLAAGVPALIKIATTFGPARARVEFDNWAKNNPQEAYDLILKTNGALALGFIASSATQGGINAIRQYDLAQLYEDLPLDDWESWYVKEEVMGFYPEETTGIQPISDQIMLRHTEISVGNTDWVQKWVDKAKIKTRVSELELVLAGEGGIYQDYAAVVADQTLMPINPQTGKIIYKPVDIKLFLSFIEHNPAFRVQLEGLATKGVYIPGWMGITGTRVLTDEQYKDLISKRIRIVISNDGQVAYYTIDQISEELQDFNQLPDLTPAQLTQIEQFLQDSVVQDLMTKTSTIQRTDIDIDLDQDQDIEPIQVLDIEPIQIEPIEPIIPVEPILLTPRELREGRQREAAARTQPLGIRLGRPAMRVRLPERKLPPSKKPEPYRVNFQYNSGASEMKEVDGRTFQQAYNSANRQRRIKGEPIQVDVEKL